MRDGGAVVADLKKGSRVTGMERDRLAGDLRRKYDSGESIRRSTIEQHVNCLRRKIGADQIVTVRGVGYRLKKMRIGYLYNGIVRWGVDRLPA